MYSMLLVMEANLYEQTIYQQCMWNTAQVKGKATPYK